MFYPSNDSNCFHRSLVNMFMYIFQSKYTLLYAFFWVIPQHLNFICRHFGTLCLFHLHRQVGACRMNWLGTCLGYYTGKGLALRCVVKFSPVVMYPFPE